MNYFLPYLIVGISVVLGVWLVRTLLFSRRDISQDGVVQETGISTAKKIVLSLGIIFLVCVFVYGLFFYKKNLTGVGPLLAPPVEDVENFAQDLSLTLPEDFHLSVFAEGLDVPRVITTGPDGSLVVSLTKAGKIVSLPDMDMDGKADQVRVVAENLLNPHGLFFHCISGGCQLYVAEEDQISVFDYDSETGTAFRKRKIVGLPQGGNHKTRTIIPFYQDGKDKMLISIGSSCNVCNEEDEHRAKIFSMNLDGSDFKEFAKGLRNSVFMVQHPVTGDLWATEMGRDMLGDDLPPDEINIIKEGGNYGWPICFGKNVHDGDFDKNTYIRNPCQNPFETGSHIDIPAHSAPLGLAFVPEEGWPEEYHFNLFVAYHGSWNRSVPTGYKIVRLKLDEQGNLQGIEDFITGWLSNGAALGRPVDIKVFPGGLMYISDDKAGVIYRVTGPQIKEEQSAGARLLSECPDEWIQNEMPMIVDPNTENPIREYYILNGERREIAEFDSEWVAQHCSIEPQKVY